MFMYTKTFPSAGHVAVKLLPSMPCYTCRITDRSYRRPRKKTFHVAAKQPSSIPAIHAGLLSVSCSSIVRSIIFVGHGRARLLDELSLQDMVASVKFQAMSPLADCPGGGSIGSCSPLSLLLPIVIGFYFFYWC